MCIRDRSFADNGFPSQTRSYRSRTRAALAAKFGSVMKIQDWYCQGLIASSASQRRTVEVDTDAAVSTSTVRRWRAEDAIKPWQYQSWIFITDPNFAAKAARVLDLYDRVWDGKPLSANDYVISADEKTSIQARFRCHPCLPPGKARMMRVSQRLPPRRCAGLPGRLRRP